MGQQQYFAKTYKYHNIKHAPIKSKKESIDSSSSSSSSSPPLTSSGDVTQQEGVEVTEGQLLKIKVHRKLALNVQKQLNLDERYFAKVSEIVVKLGTKREMHANSPSLRKKSTNPPPVCVSVAKRNVFVLNFDGDMTASQNEKFKEEVTGVIENAQIDRGDCVVVKIKSGGGTVHGYGLAAAQLERIKAKGLRIVVCVDEIAASGGYMMASVADKIYASPFAILGSIGVVSMQPNLYERLKREGVKVDEITAGKYKRTLTFFKESNAADRAKVKTDVEDILVLFKDHIKNVRPSLDVDKVATGEVWYGSEALKKNLCDEIATSDDVLLRMRADGSDVYSVTYRDPKDRLNFFEEAFSRIMTKVADLMIPDSARVERDGWNALQRTGHPESYGDMSNFQNNGHIFVKEELSKRPVL